MMAKEFYLLEKQKTSQRFQQLGAERKLAIPGSVEALAIATGIAFLQLSYMKLENKHGKI